MLITYPAIFYYNADEKVKYYVSFPDIGGVGTQGIDINDAMAMASDYLGLMLADDMEHGRVIPQASALSSLDFDRNNPFKDDPDSAFTFDKSKSFISLVAVQLSDYLELSAPVKKTLSIPKWADKIGQELHLNFSKTLTEAIAEKKMRA